MVQNKPHFQPLWEYMVSGLVFFIAFPHPSNFTDSVFFHVSALVPPLLLVHLCLPLFLPSQACTMLSVSLRPVLAVSVLPPLFSLPYPLLPPCVSGLMTELVHVELASGWRHFSCLIDRNKLLSGRSQMVTKPWEPDLKQEQATFFGVTVISHFGLFARRWNLSFTQGFWGHKMV